MVVDDVGEVISRHPVALDEHLVVERAVFHFHFAEDFVPV
jgi:hypothetical protein